MQVVICDDELGSQHREKVTAHELEVQQVFLVLLYNLDMIPQTIFSIHSYAFRPLALVARIQVES